LAEGCSVVDAGAVADRECLAPDRLSNGLAPARVVQRTAETRTGFGHYRALFDVPCRDRRGAGRKDERSPLQAGDHTAADRHEWRAVGGGPGRARIVAGSAR